MIKRTRVLPLRGLDKILSRYQRYLNRILIVPLNVRIDMKSIHLINPPFDKFSHADEFLIDTHDPVSSSPFHTSDTTTRFLSLTMA